MSQASSQAISGDVNFGDPNAGRNSLITWAIVGVVIVALVYFLKGKS